VVFNFDRIFNNLSKGFEKDLHILKQNHRVKLVAVSQQEGAMRTMQDLGIATFFDKLIIKDPFESFPTRAGRSVYIPKLTLTRKLLEEVKESFGVNASEMLYVDGGADLISLEKVVDEVARNATL